ncbi:MAG: radical SAM family heme chaperone HemW [Armatimonadetes bacterium]|nr:radical SAM family heme chaperone HemW [Armatimonadota bacterium]
MTPLAIYVHTPFCPSKCGYCDFNSFAMQGEIMDEVIGAMIAEIERSPIKGTPAKTIFFGGGTPTYLPTHLLLRLFEAVVTAHPPVAGAEITSESNPGTADAEKFAAMRSAGFNRLSLGAQSFVDSDLRMLERVHSSEEIVRAFHTARNAGFDNVNLDLMFALPRQSFDAWTQNLERALALKPDHISLYCLTIEPNTTFYKKHLRGQLELPDDEAQVAMYDHCLAETAAAGFVQYEISNFALPGKECAHNLCYWHHEDYAGYGPGAVACLGGVRGTNVKHPRGYVEAVQAGSELRFDAEPISEESRRTERIMLGLRLNEGLPTDGLDPDKLAELARRGWVEWTEDRVRLTSEGRHFCSEVALELI